MTQHDMTSQGRSEVIPRHCFFISFYVLRFRLCSVQMLRSMQEAPEKEVGSGTLPLLLLPLLLLQGLSDLSAELLSTGSDSH